MKTFWHDLAVWLIRHWSPLRHHVESLVSRAEAQGVTRGIEEAKAEAIAQAEERRQQEQYGFENRMPGDIGRF